MPSKLDKLEEDTRHFKDTEKMEVWVDLTDIFKVIGSLIMKVVSPKRKDT